MFQPDIVIVIDPQAKLAITMVFYPKLTNFWIVLILKSSEDLVLIR